MSEITLPCEISYGEKEITFEEYKQVKSKRQAEMSEEKFSTLIDECGDVEAIEDVFNRKFTVEEYKFKNTLLPTLTLLRVIDNPSWETIETAQSFSTKNASSASKIIQQIVKHYDAEDLEL